jgi:ribosomal protein S18 acetylase RimI-like enzyme
MAKISPIHTQTKNGAPLVIRAADESDASDSLALYLTVIEEGPFTMLLPDELTRTEEQEASAIRSDAEHPARLRLVASTSNMVIGMVRVSCGALARTSHFGDIDSMRVHPEYRGQGVGKALLDALITWAESQPQIEKLGLYVFSTSEAAIRLYRSRGFAEEGRGRRDIKFAADDYADTIMMGKLLANQGI